MNKKIGILVGSLRKGSFTRSIAEAAQQLFPEGIQTEFIEISHLPFFNQDFEKSGQAPESYTDFRQRIESCDGFLFAIPEYNRSFPAVIKNALDVASRPYGHSKWNDKPAAIISVSPGVIGGFGANQHLRQVLGFLNVKLVQQPEAYIGGVMELLDEQGKVKSEETKSFLQSVVNALAEMLQV